MAAITRSEVIIRPLPVQTCSGDGSYRTHGKHKEGVARLRSEFPRSAGARQRALHTWSQILKVAARAAL
jgi:hypothetical protein